MNVKQLIALSALALAGTAALADDITIANESFVAQKSRAEVRAELVKARAEGTLQQAGEGYTAVPMASQSSLTREQVRAELRNSPKTVVAAYSEAA